MNFVNVLWLSAFNSALVVIIQTFVFGIAFGSPPTFFMFLSNVEEGLLDQGMIIFIAAIYGVALLCVVETGSSWSGRYKAEFQTFCSIMSFYSHEQELKKLKNEQYSALKEHIFCSAFAIFGLIEVIGVFFIDEDLTGKWGLHFLAYLLITALLSNYSGRTRGALRLSQDKTLIVAEKQARAMNEALREELEDRDDIGF